MADTEPVDLKKLTDKFDHIEWRPKQVKQSNKDNNWYAVMVPYIDMRTVMTRLDEVVGPENWEFSWLETTQPNVVKGRLKVCGVVREDVGYFNSSNTSDETPLKTAVSDAFKRCGVQFGIGRFLYDIGNKVIKWDKQRNKPVDARDLTRLQEQFKK